MIEGLVFKLVESYEEFMDNWIKEAAKDTRFNFFRHALEECDTEEKRRASYNRYVERVSKVKRKVENAFTKEYRDG